MRTISPLTRTFPLSGLTSLPQSIDRNNRIKSTEYIYKIYVCADCTAKGANRVKGIKLHSSWKSECKSWIDLDPMQCAVVDVWSRLCEVLSPVIKHWNTTRMRCPLKGAGQQAAAGTAVEASTTTTARQFKFTLTQGSLSLSLSLHSLCESLQSRCLTSNNNSKLYLIKRDP